ncbi:MAG: ABC transporter ATP-binding protein [Chitinophagaceae bacterium]|nr:ABC transporter ATP-binding protein [Chitinophagaceae bacterium]
MVVEERAGGWQFFKFFYHYLGYRIFIVVGLSVAVGLLDGIGLTMLIPLLQSVEGGSKTDAHLGQLNHILNALRHMGIVLTLNSVLLIFIVLFVLKGCFRFVEQMYNRKVHIFFMRKIQFSLIQHLQEISYKGFLELDAGQIQNTFIAEVYRMSTAMRTYLKWSQALLMLSTYIGLAFLANFRFALLVVISSVLTNLLYKKLHNKIKSASLEISKTGHRLNAYMIEIIQYFKYLKSTNYLQGFAKKVKRVIKQTQYNNQRIGFYSAISSSIREPLIVMIVVSVIFVQLNWIGGSLGSIILSLLLFYRGLNFLLTIQNEWQSFIVSSGAFKTISEVTEKMKRLKEIQGAISFKCLKEGIKIKDADVSYGRTRVLENVNVCISKNSTIAFVGPSGSGKTTLVNVISGLLFPESGNTFVDGIPLSDYNLNSYRSKIGYISQEPVVFNDTIFNNVTFWAEKNEDNLNQFWKVVEIASLTEFIQELEQKEDTALGDHGILISGGQRQRISIARELFKNPEILILDEATSALDSETEHLIQENIEKLHGSYTMVIIAHRLSTIKKADTIYLLDKGKVIQSGTFSTLLETSDKFRNMVSLQKVLH